jgi:Flp pilus assembly pilin Flp
VELICRVQQKRTLIECARITRKLMASEVRTLTHLLRKLWRHDEGQDIAEYAVMLAVILVLVVGTIRLIGSNASNVFSNAASSIQ